MSSPPASPAAPDAQAAPASPAATHAEPSATTPSGQTPTTPDPVGNLQPTAHPPPSEAPANSPPPPLQLSRNTGNALNERLRGFDVMYPHLMDVIIDAADYESRLALRAVNRRLCKLIDNCFATHLTWFEDAMHTSNAAREMWRHPLPILTADLPLALAKLAPWEQDFRNILRSTRCLDLREVLPFEGCLDAEGVPAVRIWPSFPTVSLHVEGVDTLVMRAFVPIARDPFLAAMLPPGLAPPTPSLPPLPDATLPRLLWERAPPRRVVIHLDPENVSYATPRGMDPPQFPETTPAADSELVLVAIHWRNFDPSDLDRIIENLLTSPALGHLGRVFNSYVFVQSSPGRVTTLNHRSLTYSRVINDGVKASLRKHVSPDIQIRCFTTAEWRAEISRERHYLEMGV